MPESCDDMWQIGHTKTTETHGKLGSTIPFEIEKLNVGGEITGQMGGN